MASVEKFTDEEVSAMLLHNDRERDTYSNKDIDSERTNQNYSIPLNHGELNNHEYYKKIIGEKYLYGRGSSREKDAITAAGWVITLPRDITEGSAMEKAFFQGAFDFVADRYGKENIINNAVHYDEGGQPHIHIIFVPSTTLNHDQVHFKTQKTTTAIQTESGRYEFSHRFKLDENGEKIPLKNYAKMSDYYNEKISANDVLNKAELKHFHEDLQKYLSDKGIKGTVYNGSTSGVNFTVKELKEFTKNTGLTLDEIKEHLTERTILESFVERDEKVQALEQSIREKDVTIESLKEELERTKERVRELENEKTVEASQTTREQSWGDSSSGWGTYNKEQNVIIGED